MMLQKDVFINGAYLYIKNYKQTGDLKIKLIFLTYHGGKTKTLI